MQISKLHIYRYLKQFLFLDETLDVGYIQGKYDFYYVFNVRNLK